MTVTFNGKQVDLVQYQGQEINELQINGNTVWTKTVVEVVPSGTVVYESKKAGTEQLTITTEGTYNITCIGAGGGGAAWLYKWSIYPQYWRSSSASGGAGGRLIKAVTLTPGVYAVRVGTAGTGDATYINNNNNQQPSYPATVYSTAGLSSFISGPSGLFEAGGGGGASAGNGVATGGVGGSGETQKGNTGAAYYTLTGVSRTTDNGGNYVETYTSASVNGSSYGKGGGAQAWYRSIDDAFSYYGYDGTDGYVKIVKA